MLLPQLHNSTFHSLINSFYMLYLVSFNPSISYKFKRIQSRFTILPVWQFEFKRTIRSSFLVLLLNALLIYVYRIPIIHINIYTNDVYNIYISFQYLELIECKAFWMKHTSVNGIHKWHKLNQHRIIFSRLINKN